jgi:hypothetical protein
MQPSRPRGTRAEPKDISLTDFVDFTLKAGPAKVTKVREIKHRDDYEPAVDFWKPLREGIVDLTRTGKVDKRSLDALIDAQTHGTKQRLYPAAAKGFLKFLGRRPWQWMVPLKGTWTAGRLTVKVNPEIALRIAGRPTVIKLYFKSQELKRPNVQASIGVMVDELGSGASAETQFGILDVKAGKLLTWDGRWSPIDTQILIRGEAQSFVAIWDSV